MSAIFFTFASVLHFIFSSAVDELAFALANGNKLSFSGGKSDYQHNAVTGAIQSQSIDETTASTHDAITRDYLQARRAMHSHCKLRPYLSVSGHGAEEATLGWLGRG